MKTPVFAAALSVVLSSSFVATAQADKLDDIISSGKLGVISALDADSCDIRGAVHEGIYYLWNPELLDDACYADPVPTGMGRPSQGGME